MAREFRKSIVASIPDDQPDDPMAGCCNIITVSGRCHYPGVLSFGGGKFYCREHFYRRVGKVPFDPDAVTAKSHYDIPNPDYSLEARQKLSQQNFEKERSEWKGRKSPIKTSYVIGRLTHYEPGME